MIQVKYTAFGLAAHEGVMYVEHSGMAYRVINKWNKDSSRMKDRPYLYVLFSTEPDTVTRFDDLTWYTVGDLMYGIKK